MEDTGSSTTQPPHVVIVPTPGMGHLIPLAEFAKRMIPEFSFTFAVPTDGQPSSAHRSFLSSLPSAINSVFLPPPDLSDVPTDAKAETIICLTAARSIPSLRTLIADLISSGTRVVALVVDLFGTDAFPLASEFRLRPYIFFPTTAMCLSSIFHLEMLDETVPCEYAELDEPVKIPGCVPIHGRDLMDPVQDRKNDAYKWLLHHAKRYKLAEGIMVNSFEALEADPLRELSRPGPGKPPVYAVGPLIQAGSGKEEAYGERPECLDWLDKQPRGSVLFVNFGSGGTLSSEQQKELALGLEKSRERFLWVVRAPNDSMANAAYFSVDGQIEPLRTLPEGFLERTKGRGLMMPKWAPQIRVLSHASTGGFLSHCGWNSTLESVVHGVPLITWPLYAEQKMNTVILTKVLNVGLRPMAEGADGVVKSDEVARVVNELMQGDEGKRIRMRMKELKDAASAAMSNDGSSSKALKEVSRKWKNE